MVQLIRYGVVHIAEGKTIAKTYARPPDPVTRGEDSDAALAARAANSDIRAFGELVSRHQRSVYAVVSRMVDDRDDVDDIVQEVFVLAYRAIRSFRGHSAFSTWIYRIAVNTTIKHMKKIKLRRAASINDPESGIGDTLRSPDDIGPEEAAQRSERNRALRAAISTLPEKHRAVVVLHYFNDCSCEEIARIMQCSVGTVWSRLHYACKKLKAQLGALQT